MSSQLRSSSADRLPFSVVSLRRFRHSEMENYNISTLTFRVVLVCAKLFRTFRKFAIQTPKVSKATKITEVCRPRAQLNNSRDFPFEFFAREHRRRTALAKQLAQTNLIIKNTLIN